MGRDLGYFASDELDRPELNKCPDCECFFASEECPLCGKICPENFRAGNRAKVKKPKKRQNSSGRVQFIPVYHTWWFILIVFLFSRLAGAILFLTSPYSKKAKIIVVSAAAGVFLLTAALPVVLGWTAEILTPSPVNDDIPRAEYVALCEPMSVEDYYRDAYNEGNYVTLDLVVKYPIKEGGETYYLCTALDGGEVEILLCDYSVEKKTNYIQGDMIRVYGECSGVEMSGFTTEACPLLYMAYSQLIG